MRKVLVSVGTRPEAIKMAPVYLALQKRDDVDVTLLATGQHKEQLGDGLRVFGLEPRKLYKTTIARHLSDIDADIVRGAAMLLRDTQPDLVVVHGDTLSTFAVAFAAFLEKIPVAHVEAGLRSDRPMEPFPEEMLRRLVGQVSALDLAPTQRAADRLALEGKTKVVVTGQTGVDAIRYAAQHATLPSEFGSGPFVTVTLHRRENWDRLPEMARGIADVAWNNQKYTFVVPMHRNPIVREALLPAFIGIPNVIVRDALDYGAMAAVLLRSALIITDSGGLQEEGASLGVPVVCCRNVTERPEGTASGIVTLAGTDALHITHHAENLLNDDGLRHRLSLLPNPFGDGKAGQRCADAIAWHLGLADRPQDWHPTTAMAAA